MNFWIRTSFSAIEMKYVSYLLGPFQKFSSLDEVFVDHYLRRKHRGHMGRRCHLRHSAALRLSRCAAIDITLLNSQETLSIHHSLDHLWPPRARACEHARESSHCTGPSETLSLSVRLSVHLLRQNDNHRQPRSIAPSDSTVHSSPAAAAGGTPTVCCLFTL